MSSPNLVSCGSPSLYKPLFGCLLPLLAAVISSTYKTPSFFYTIICSVISVTGFISSFCLIPIFASTLKKKGLEGKDLNKVEEADTVPESLGLVAATVFILCAISCQLLFSNDPAKLLEYNSGLLAICLMAFLGFVDDVIDLRWRYKIILPIAAALPLVIAYQGLSTIVIPRVLLSYIPNTDGILDLGLYYRVYMTILTLFCTNSINIYAGINGLEVGQSLVMCAAVIINNLLDLHTCLDLISIHPKTALEIVIVNAAQSKLDQHIFSLLLSLPFFGCSLALFWFNWYPSRVFVGDTFTYFAGVYFAVVGILGHFSKTLLLFFIPQIINFVLSIPQLLGFIHCPRHRVPRINKQTGKLHFTPNGTLINAVLYIIGPTREDKLCIILLAFQAASCGFGLYLHHRFLRLGL